MKFKDSYNNQLDNFVLLYIEYYYEYIQIYSLN